AGEQVWRRYNLWDRLNESFSKVMKETNANVPFVAGALQVGKYDLLIIAPLTANSTAKIAYGIADTLVTNAVAQTLKGTTPVMVYPVDQKPGQVEIISPKGMRSVIKTREIDLQNASRLREMEGVIVVALPSEIPERVANLLGTN
ncbi:MAG: flavoprotein, partial [Candidatus Thorarchaeota archaeon]